MPHDSFSLLNIADGEDKSSPLKNCIRNNYRHIRKWAKRTQTNSFRIYDRQIKEYPLAIDYYDGQFCVHYFSAVKAQGEVPKEVVEKVESSLCSLFTIEPNVIHWRSRIKRTRVQQYEKRGKERNFFSVLEYGVRFNINLTDYLDTGLFLDHRETRRLVALEAKEKRLLNLFAYTCSFSVHAAVMGATSTKSVDLSNTYTKWGKENFLLNGCSLRSNTIIRADCLQFLNEEVAKGETYDLIVIDPPTISRSKKMEQLFDIQKEYSLLIHQALHLLAPQGTIYFSTNSRKFAFDHTLFPKATIREISAKTIPLDFHNAKIHRCWKIKAM